MITHLAYVPIFTCAVFLVGDCDHIEAMDAIYALEGKKTRCELTDGPLGSVRSVGGDVFCYIKDLEAGSVMFHELTHVACSIMEIHGIPLCTETEEVMAYLVGWLKINVMDPIYEKREALLS